MQGIIFNALEEFVLTNTDMETWNRVIENSKVASQGVYTSGGSYDDNEIVSLATELCQQLGVSLEDGLKMFGEFLFGYLIEKGPVEISSYSNTQELLKNLEDVVHKDVKRIHPDAYTPFFQYTAQTESQGELIYYSKRKLCVVAEGLLQGAAKFYGQNINMKHTSCMHDGAEKCHWNVKFSTV
ncbi:heme NO-binding domain-containing protein [Oceaniserpentilla sp. 4NH20-0058]|uniref:heme NO-binding domain-containing protein n=1 Tax=Oceaniserpentilla sp. 4NH20-0058 TaxID=3127660 RepID=UPI00310C1FA0